MVPRLGAQINSDGVGGHSFRSSGGGDGVLAQVVGLFEVVASLGHLPLTHLIPPRPLRHLIKSAPILLEPLITLIAALENLCEGTLNII